MLINSHNQPNQVDPFNWKFPQRSDLMSQSICNNGDVTGSRRIRSQTISQDYRYNDCGKATYLNKISYVNKCDDIQGAKPNILQNISIENTRNSMKVDDILGTHPQKLKFITNRCSNPLQPVYYLATASILPIENIKFIRDTLDITDIEGAKGKKDPWYNKIRNYDPYTEIDGSKTKQQKIIRDSVDKYNVQDINNKIHLKPKQNNPLEPLYNWNSGSAYGYVDGSKSTIQHPDKKNTDKNLSLNTDQIDGCKADSIRQNFYLKDSRRQHSVSNKISDIPGTQIGSCAKGLRTNRHINPLNPIYDL